MKLILPFSVVLPRKKGDRVWILNLNSYRNTHFQILNQCKIAWKSVVLDAVEHWYKSEGIIPIARMSAPYHFTYTAFPGTNRAFDIANVCSVIDKFTCDALQEFGMIGNDNYKSIPEVVYRFGGVDKENPRVELEINGG
jgi:hypothetical protein